MIKIGIKRVFTLSACALAIASANAEQEKTITTNSNKEKPLTLEVIEVTAQKRPENTQETPSTRTSPCSMGALDVMGSDDGHEVRQNHGRGGANLGTPARLECNPARLGWLGRCHSAILAWPNQSPLKTLYS